MVGHAANRLRNADAPPRPPPNCATTRVDARSSSKRQIYKTAPATSTADSRQPGWPRSDAAHSRPRYDDASASRHSAAAARQRNATTGARAWHESSAPDERCAHGMRLDACKRRDNSSAKASHLSRQVSQKSSQSSWSNAGQMQVKRSRPACLSLCPTLACNYRRHDRVVVPIVLLLTYDPAHHAGPDTQRENAKQPPSPTESCWDARVGNGVSQCDGDAEARRAHGVEPWWRPRQGRPASGRHEAAVSAEARQSERVSRARG